MYRHGRRKESDAAGIRGPVHDDTVRTGGRSLQVLNRFGRSSIAVVDLSISTEGAKFDRGLEDIRQNLLGIRGWFVFRKDVFRGFWVFV